MTQGAPIRRILLDLTPVIDVIMILLFGVMIHSVERSKVETRDLQLTAEQAVQRSDADRQALLEAGEQAKALAAENEGLQKQVDKLRADLAIAQGMTEDAKEMLVQQRFSFSEFVANLLQIDDPKKLTFKLPIKNDTTKQQANIDAAEVYKAIKRIEEMKKVFTFVDLHIDSQDFLTVSVDARRLERMPVRSRPATEIENSLRKALEASAFNEVVLILFSYEADTLDRTVETAEAAVDMLLTHYRARWSGVGKQFRYGRVGLVESAPVSVD